MLFSAGLLGPRDPSLFSAGFQLVPSQLQPLGIQLDLQARPIFLAENVVKLYRSLNRETNNPPGLPTYSGSAPVTCPPIFVWTSSLQLFIRSRLLAASSSRKLLGLQSVNL